MVTAMNPTTGKAIARVRTASLEEYAGCISAMEGARRVWGSTPAPRRGEIVRLIGIALREKR